METHILHIPSSQPQWSSLFPNRNLRILIKAVLVASSLLLILGITGSAYIWNRYEKTMLANTHIAEKDVSNLTPEEIKTKLVTEVVTPEYSITVSTPETEYATSSGWLQLTPEINTIVDQAYLFGHQGNFFQKLWERWWSFLGYQRNFKLSYHYSDDRIQDWVTHIAENVFLVGSEPAALWSGNTYRIDAGALGQKLDEQRLITDINRSIGETTTLIAPIEVTHTPLSADGQIFSEQRLQRLQAVRLTLHINDAEPTRSLTPNEFFPWLKLPDGFHTASMSSDLLEITQDWNRPPQNAIFELNENNQLTEFVPDKPGREIELAQLVDTVSQSLAQASASETDAASAPIVITVPIIETPADIPLSATNSLGIQELLGRGTSTFFGSIPNRVYNVELTSKRLHATLVEPGEEFSFNRAIGPVNASTGYKSAYVIQDGRTVLGDGGGVCQVSTTIFRAALDAGFPITQWKAHSYRVGYYEQNTDPGFDATVYAPSVDFRFKNDTDHAIVVSTSIDVPSRHLAIEIWGTSDGRTSTISDYTAWNQRGAPAPLYQDDPSLPRGTIRQIDWAAPGLNTRFTYTVTDKNSKEMHSRDFTSYFRPWQAVYLVGTGN